MSGNSERFPTEPVSTAFKNAGEWRESFRKISFFRVIRFRFQGAASVGVAALGFVRQIATARTIVA